MIPTGSTTITVKRLSFVIIIQRTSTEGNVTRKSEGTNDSGLSSTTRCRRNIDRPQVGDYMWEITTQRHSPRSHDT